MLETSPVQTGGEGTSLELIQVDLRSPQEARAEPGSGADQEHPIFSFLVKAKTKPMTRFASKQGPFLHTPTSTKRATKAPGMESSSKRPKR